ncbi:MAG: ABC transporter ATP-binding protein [Candidatus Woesearchaeota archaeon]
MPEPFLVLDNLSIKQGTCTIQEINAEFSRGDIVGIVGRSGSGKSTFFKALVGQAKILKGDVHVYEESRMKDIRDYLGYSPQENSLYPYLTLEENITIFAQLHGLKRSVRKKRMEMLLARLGLKKDAKKRIINLSGGMQKRADLAVSLIHDPEIIILDEPFNGLDISLQKFIWDFLEELSEQGKLIIISSHFLPDLQKRCNTFALIEQGYFYNNESLKKYLSKNKEDTIESFLRRIFTK